MSASYRRRALAVPLGILVAAVLVLLLVRGLGFGRSLGGVERGAGEGDRKREAFALAPARLTGRPQEDGPTGTAVAEPSVPAPKTTFATHDLEVRVRFDGIEPRALRRAC